MMMKKLINELFHSLKYNSNFREYQLNKGTTMNYTDSWGDSNHDLIVTKFFAYVCEKIIPKKRYLQAHDDKIIMLLNLEHFEDLMLII